MQLTEKKHKKRAGILCAATKGAIRLNPADLLTEILSGGCIRPAYQPIVSLSDGEILGYEALSRISLPSCALNIEQLFELATGARKLWELEKLCRTQALKGARDKPGGAKLFLNVDANIIYDPEFIEGFTREMLRGFGLDPDEIIFEVTEKSMVATVDAFTAAIGHYQSQNFKIAIDDFGTGYSGMTRACAVSPNYLKLDMSIVRGIDQDRQRRSAVLGIVKFCKEAGICLIAEGIETREELSALIQMGVDYGQGYLLGRPEGSFQPPREEIRLLIRSLHQGGAIPEEPPSVFGTVGAICQRKPPIPPQAQALPLYEKMRADPSLTEICVADGEGYILGLFTRSGLLGRFSGQFGYSLYCRRVVGDVLSPSDQFLAVDCGATVDAVAALAMERDYAHVYDAVIVTDRGRYLGVVTVRDLLTAAIRIQVKNAADASPLTGLPGNNAIQRTINEAVGRWETYAIVYLDLDNFKAYNDAYGFANGDKMLRILAQSMEYCCADADFKGHIGGDDFVIVTRDAAHVEQLCGEIIRTFSERICTLYSPLDWNRGYIVSQNRSGFTENFPVATLSIAAVTNTAVSFCSTTDLSQTIAAAKKTCKQRKGNAVVTV